MQRISYIYAWLAVLTAVLSATTFAANLASKPPATAISRETLGERLFFDSRLSADGQVSCASCHQPAKQFSDGLPLAAGFMKRKGTRNTPSLLDVAQQRSLFWDGRRESLETQALDPMLNPAEHGLTGEGELLKQLRRDPGYVQAFHFAFGPADGRPFNGKKPQVRANAITAERVAQALAAYQRTLVSGAAPFDRYQAGDVAAMEPAARRGWTLFSTSAQCTRCHEAGENDVAPVLPAPPYAQ